MSFFSRRKWSKHPSKNSTPRRHCRLSVELLEDRRIPSVFLVTNTLDAGLGTLRQAILDANANPGPDLIDFNIPGTGVQTIAVGDTTGLPLPIITDPVAIDGYSQPGASINTLSVGDNAVVLIELDGSAPLLGPGFNGLQITAGNSTIRGLMIDNFARGPGPAFAGGSAILLDTNGGNVLEGNILGTHGSGGPGTFSNGNSDVTVEAGSANNVIGGTTPDTRNVISGALAGTVIDAGSGGNSFEGNYVGTDPGGTSAVANFDGLVDLGTGDTIGGTVSGARNVFSGNGRAGVVLSAVNDVVEGNFIGINAQETATLSNASFGILAASGSGDTIGGTAAGAGNIIGGVSGIGIEIDDSGAPAGTNGFMIQNNFIGTDKAGSLNFANAIGILIEGDAVAQGVANNTVSGNVIDNESLVGVEIFGVGAKDNVVEGNRIGTNPNGTLARGNEVGVKIAGGAFDNTVGGTSAAARNVISGNVEGVVISDSGTTSNLVEGNYVGTNAAGSGALANTEDGIELLFDGGNNTIGGTTAGAGNVLSGNGRAGVVISAVNDVLEGNLIGINAQGTAVLTNASFGILAAAASGDTIGGTIPGAGNVIGGLSGVGIEIDDSGAPSGTNNFLIQGNFFGTDPTGTLNFGNAIGILLEGNAVTQGVANNTIGGTAPGAGNVIANEFLVGVEIFGVAANNNLVLGNMIGTDPTGMVAHGNKIGVKIAGGAIDNLVGGTTAAARNVISGNVVGVDIQDSGTAGNVVEGNYVGTNAVGSGALANTEDGIDLFLDGGNNTVGGTAVGAGNVFSGNGRAGVDLAFAVNDVVEGNLIGVNAQGTARLSNFSFGILASGGSGDVIGGTAAGAGNVIGGLAGEGIEIDDSGAPSGTNNFLIQGNFFGTDRTAALNFGNAIGILLEGNAVTQGVANITVGGTAAGAGNVIANESLVGVEILGVGANNNLVQGNFIGTDATGTALLGNGVGIEVAGGAHNNVIGGPVLPTVVVAGAGNVIAHNTGTGVVIGSSITDAGTVGNTIRGNSIYANGGLGIDLGNDGVTPNHASNPSPGPNNLQNFPVLASAVSLPKEGSTRINGSLQSTPNTTFTLDFYASATANPSGFGEGQRYLGSAMVTTDGTGNVSFSVPLSAATTVGEVVSATATNMSTGDTSEFSAVVTVHGRRAPSAGSTFTNHFWGAWLQEVAWVDVRDLLHRG